MLGFSVIICTRSRPRVLADTVASVLACRPGPDELVVVDGSETGSARRVMEEAGPSGRSALRYLRSPPGACRQRNFGMARARGEVLVFLDDDAVLPPDAFGVLGRAYRDPDVVGATGRIIEPEPHRFGNTRSIWRRILLGSGAHGRMTSFGYPRRLQPLDEEADVEFMPGCCMTARAEVAKRLSFDEHLEEGLPYALAEDEDFSYRLSRCGRLRYLPALRVEHRNLGVLTVPSRAFNRQVVVNRSYLFAKNFDQTIPARLRFALLLVVLAGHRAINADWRGLQGLLEGVLSAWRTLGRRSP
jgi:glucosyl-dolichyl phosphate glucuronosyltransferase